MIFLNYWFAAAVPLFFAAYWLVRPLALRRYVLLLGCAIFHYHFAGPAGVLPIVALGLLTYGCGLVGGKLAPAIGIVACAATLLAYKYAIFLAVGLVGQISPALGAALAADAQGLLPDLPPLGLSFFAFEFAHYLVEVRRGHAKIKSPVSFALFAIFWPSLVAGPIKRYPQFLATLHDGVRRVGRADVAAGLLRLTTGLLKKFAADYLTQLITFWTANFAVLTVPQRWGIVVAIAFRILFDFSGYTDMAIGFARMMGIRLPENFNWPYLATSLTEFWRRWHISLSSWIRDYIYVPLGGSRHGTPRRILNGLIAFAICGLWHGAAWHFALWGVYHGVGLAVSSAGGALIRGALRPVADRVAGGTHRALAAAGAVGCWMLTQLFVMLGWLLFFYPLATASLLGRQLVTP